MARLVKDPDNKTYFIVDYSGWLQADETISASTWIHSSDLTTEAESTFTTTNTTFVVSGGTAGVQYDVVNRITYAKTGISAVDLTEDRTITIHVQEK